MSRPRGQRRATMSMPQAETMSGSTGRKLPEVARVDRDAALVEGLRQGDPAAPEQLLDTYGDRVYRLAVRITGSEEDAEEVVQDALWTAARKIGTFKGESAFGSWLYRITANAAYQKIRSRHGKRREISWEDLLPAFEESGRRGDVDRDWSAQTDEPAVQAELRTALTKAVSELPRDYRTAFVLHDVEGLSNPEIAEALHISLPAVKSRVHRSRLFLRQKLADYMRVA